MKTASFRLAGPWAQGFVLDVHTLGSVYLGDDEFGHPVFETTRSELGNLLYRLKYQSDLGGLPQLVEAVAGFIQGWGFQPDVLVPVPPSNAGRAVQPVYLIAEAVAAKLGVAWDRDALVRMKAIPALKNVFHFQARIDLLDGAHAVRAERVRGRRVLLFDDLYRSGATLSAAARALRDEGQVAEVRVLAVTRTRSRR